MQRLSSHPNPAMAAWRLSKDVERCTPHFYIMRRILQVLMCTLWKLRCFGRYNEPAKGSVLYICNHQSFLDPMLVSLGLLRPLNYMARDSLFRGLFGKLIWAFNAFPVKRNSADTGAIKEAMRRLKANGQVAIFAEGTRTLDGRIAPLLPGVAFLAQRAADWTVPVVIDGAFEAWPRSQKFPRTGSVIVEYGQAIPRQQAQAMSGEEFARTLRQTLIDMQTDVRRRSHRAALTYDEPEAR